MATTPPLRNSVQIPSTPLHGAKFDICHSSKINKKSTRQSLRQSRRAAQTPSVVNKQYCAESQRLASTYSPPSSANTTPPERTTRKRRRSSLGATIDESMDPSLPRGSGNVDPLVVPDHSKLLGQGPLNLAANMLPTPARTPRKQDKRKASELQSAARILFPGRHEKVEDAMPTAKGRRGRKNIGFSLDSSGEDDGVKDPIQIFTDSKDRYPELDPGHHNPFLEKSDKSESAEPRAPHKVRGRRGRKTKGQVQTNPHIKDAFNHEEGMVYVFRGKKIFRRFTPDPDHPNLSSEETEIEGSISPRLRPLTRAAVKPRLLFPTEKQRIERERPAEDVSAENVEDHGHAVTKEEKPVTPVKSSFAPATPPTTGHATRSMTRKAAADGGASPLEAATVPEGRHRNTSPFYDWQRTKTKPDAHGRGMKRGAEQIEMDGVNANHKKIKGRS